MQNTSDAGTYILILHLTQEKTLRIGRLGEFLFHSGYYIYVGSALRNLSARVQRHQRSEKKFHWHIDYLRAEAELIDVFVIREPVRHECSLSADIAHIADGGIARFGSSDCHCSTHLHFFRQHPLNSKNFLTLIRTYSLLPFK